MREVLACAQAVSRVDAAAMPMGGEVEPWVVEREEGVEHIVPACMDRRVGPRRRLGAPRPSRSTFKQHGSYAACGDTMGGGTHSASASRPSGRARG